MKATLLVSLSILCVPVSALAWGRHDLITRMVLEPARFDSLRTIKVTPEPIEQAAPDLLARVIPELEKWCERYHREHDTRYEWKIPSDTFLGRKLEGREALLWALEDNIHTPLEIDAAETHAAEILARYVDEPDGPLDGELNQPPYLERVRPSMSYFYQEGDSHTHSFRHAYVEESVIPPVFHPTGVAPYRAALYAKLAEGAFMTGHPYWGYRFLAWAIHYAQDVTQPWHTVYLPGFSFLKFSKAKMKHEISALHYLAEAFSDTWLLTRKPDPNDTSGVPEEDHSSDPWYVARITERLAQLSHEKAPLVAGMSRAFFGPVVDRLNMTLYPKGQTIIFGGVAMNATMLDFGGNGSGAARFLTQTWSRNFGRAKERDELLSVLISQIKEAVEGSRLILSHVLHQASMLRPYPTFKS